MRFSNRPWPKHFTLSEGNRMSPCTFCEDVWMSTKKRRSVFFKWHLEEFWWKVENYEPWKKTMGSDLKQVFLFHSVLFSQQTWRMDDFPYKFMLFSSDSSPTVTAIDVSPFQFPYLLVWLSSCSIIEFQFWCNKWLGKKQP